MAGREVLFLDETSFNLWMRKSRIWMRRCNPIRVKINQGCLKYVTLYGAISSKQERFFYQIASATNSSNSVLFIDKLAAAY